MTKSNIYFAQSEYLFNFMLYVLNLTYKNAVLFINDVITSVR